MGADQHRFGAIVPRQLLNRAGIVAEKIRTALAEPYWLSLKRKDGIENTLEYHCTSSIGVVLFINHEASQENVLKCADIARHQAKESGRNRVNIFSP